MATRKTTIKPYYGGTIPAILPDWKLFKAGTAVRLKSGGPKQIQPTDGRWSDSTYFAV